MTHSDFFSTQMNHVILIELKQVQHECMNGRPCRIHWSLQWPLCINCDAARKQKGWWDDGKAVRQCDHYNRK